MGATQAIAATATTTRVNVRQGAPNTKAPVLRKLDSGVPVNVVGVTTGENIQGNSVWYEIDANAYIWSGGCAPLSASLPPPSASEAPNVVDISHGDQVADFSQARAAGLIGVIHKATTGGTGRDDLYATRRALAAKAGLLWGAYHWGTAAPVDQQIQNFLGAASPDANTLVALDFESDPGNQMTLDMARQFLQGIQDKLNRHAVLYSGNLIKDQLGSTKDSFFGAHRLWLAQYGPTPKVQASWNTFWLWQYTDGTDRTPKVTVPGIPGDAKGSLDCDHFMGSEALLREQWAS